MLNKIFSVFAISFALSLAIFVLFFVSTNDIAKSDFPSFLTGAEIVRTGRGSELYNLDVQLLFQKEITGNIKKEIFLPFRNLPFVALLFLPFSGLGLVAGYKVFAIINILLILLSSYYISGKLRLFSKNNLYFLLPFLFIANLSSIFYGQLTLLLSLILTLVYLKLKEKKEFVAGLLLGFLLIKPQYLISLPFFYLTSAKKADFLKGFLFSFLPLFIVNFLITPSFFTKYLNFIFITEKISFGSNINEMFSVPSLFLFLIEKNILNFGIYILILASFYLFFLYLFIKKRKKATLEESFVNCSFASVFFAPHVFAHELSVLTPSILLVPEIIKSKARRQRVFRAIGLLILFLLPATSFYTFPGLVFVNVGLLALSWFLINV